MKRNLYGFAILLVSLVFTQAAFADVKIKTRQSMSGQSYENTTLIKGKRQRTERNMGGMQMVDITQCDLKRSVQMNPMAKTYMINLFDTGEPATQTPTQTAKTDKVVRSGGTVTTTYTIKDTGERKQMFGYTAKHLIITMETVSSPDACSPTNSKMEMDGWYIDAEFALDCDWGASYRGYQGGKAGGCQDKYVMKQNGTTKRGYPVYEKMTMFDKDGKESFSMINEVVELSKATLDAALFEVPSDYREVSDASQMYNMAAASNGSTMSVPNTGNASNSANSGMKMPSQTANTESPAELGPKQPGTVRIGVTVKTGAVGEGITAADLAAAVQNTLGEYLKGTKIELVPLEAKLAALIDGEARKKECDFVLLATVSHKKGGGGFGGMFGNVLAPAIGSVGLGHTGSVAGNIAGQVATQAIVSAGQVSANVKAKDEISLDVKLNQTGGASVLSKQFKNKAKSDGQDIISPTIEQAAQVIVDATKK
jgi:hypothetical protein